MIIEDSDQVEKKLSQVGYYRLSGYWYICRQVKRDKNGDAIYFAKKILLRHEDFMPDTSFNSVYKLYLFDKKFRHLMLDAIERIEIYLRSIIAHELGKKDPLAYKKNDFINPKFHNNLWNKWSQRQNTNLKRSKEDCIKWHKENYNEYPFWVVIEAWDFGTTSTYFKMLKSGYQNNIGKKLGVMPKDIKKLIHWLEEINILRNRCAHHTRIWNQNNNNNLKFPVDPYFENLDLDEISKKKIFGLIVVISFLIKKFSTNSEWILDISNLMETKPNLPGCKYSSMGIPETGFPISKFEI